MINTWLLKCFVISYCLIRVYYSISLHSSELWPYMRRTKYPTDATPGMLTWGSVLLATLKRMSRQLQTSCFTLLKNLNHLVWKLCSESTSCQLILELFKFFKKFKCQTLQAMQINLKHHSLWETRKGQWDSPRIDHPSSKYRTSQADKIRRWKCRGFKIRCSHRTKIKKTKSREWNELK